MRSFAAILLLGCGAASPSAVADSPECALARSGAGDAWAHLAELTSVPATAEAVGPSSFDAAMERLQTHVADLRERPREVDGETAMAVSGVVMDAFDSFGSELPASVRNRGDNAAEALLTDRSAGGSVRAALAAAEALEEALAAADPEAAAGRAEGQGLERLRRRAQSAADGYGESARAGDQRAAHAEAGAVPETLGDEPRQARAAAIDASAEARDTCGFSRSLMVPSL